MRLHGFAFALALFTISGIARAEDRHAALPPELSWVPPNCAAFVHVRVADLWDSPAGKTVREVLANSIPDMIPQLEKALFLGIRFSQIDRITIVLPEFLDAPSFQHLVVRITTTEPYDGAKVLAALKVDKVEATQPPGANRKIYRSNRGAIHLTDSKNLTLLLDQGAIGLLGKLLEHETTGGLSPALRMAAEKHHIVAAIDVSQFRNLPVDELPPVFRPLLDARLAMFTSDLKPESADFDVRLTFGRKGHAADGVKALEAARAELLKMLGGVVAELMDNKEGAVQLKILEEIVGAFKAAKITDMDPEVLATASFKTTGPLAVLAKEGVNSISIASNRAKSQNNLKQIGLAMHNYETTFGKLPPAAICDKNGKPLLSWRVAILPFIKQDNLYKQFRLDEPWDSEHNKKLATVTVPTLMLPGDMMKRDFPSTYYRVFYGNDAMFDLKNGTKFAQVTDGLSNTILVVEASEAVPWTKPDELEYDPKQTPKLGYLFGDRCNALFGDGHVYALKKSLKTEKLHLLIQKSDGIPISPD